MEIKLLKSFVAVAEMQSFSAAARKLNTVQPAISRQISDLEEQVGVSLFWRNTREVKITAAGESLLVDAYDILERIDKAAEQARRAGRGETGRLRVGYLGSACLSFLPMLVQEYQKQYPSVQVSLSEMTVQEQIEAFGNGQIDIGFSRPLANGVETKIAKADVYLDSLTALLSNMHPLAGSKQIRFDQLKDESFILFSRNEARGLYDKIIHACHNHGFVPDVKSQPKAMQTVLTEVASGLGVSIVPGCVQRLYGKGCAFVPIQGVNSSIPLELHYVSTEQSATVEAFVKLVVELKQRIQELVSN